MVRFPPCKEDAVNGGNAERKGSSRRRLSPTYNTFAKNLLHTTLPD